MKTKSILLSSLLLFVITISQAQSGYAGLGIGYGMPTVGSVLGYNSNSNNPANTFSTENVKGSFGKGLNFGAYFGVMLGSHIGFELGANYLLGAKYTFTNNDVNGNSSTNRTQDVSAKSLRVNPCVRITTDDGKLRPYLRGGMTFGVMNKMTSHYTQTDITPGETDITIETSEYTGGISFGFSGAIGVAFTLTEKLSLYGELNTYFCNWAATNGELTKSTFNGTDELGSMTTDEKKFEYVDKIDQSMNTSSSAPTKALKTYSPMSSFGLNVGLHLVFGKSK